MILLLLACTTHGDGDGQNIERTMIDAESTDSASPTMPDIEQEPAVATLTPDDIVVALEEALSRPPDPSPILDTYIDLMAAGDSTCPGSDYILTDTWLYGCEATTGYSYAGITDWMDDDTDSPGGVAQLTVLAGDFWIDTPDGHQLEGGGHAARVQGDTVWISEMVGSWRWTDGPDWLSHGYSGNIVIEHIAGIVTSMKGAADINGTYVTAHELAWPNSCNGGASGALSLRDPTGGWYRIEFEDCSTCGDLSFEGLAMGEVCLDFSPFLTEISSRL
jgi:hypothetical protein